MTKTRKIRQPPKKGKKNSPPTMERMLADLRKVFGFQLNTFLAQFVDSHTDEQINAFLPEDVAEADEWIEGHISAFTENEEPTTDEIIDGVSALFMMAFLERLYEQCGITNDEDEDTDGEDEDEYEDDGEDEGEDATA